MTSLDFKKQIWEPLITHKGDKAIAHFGFATRVKE